MRLLVLHVRFHQAGPKFCRQTTCSNDLGFWVLKPLSGLPVSSSGEWAEQLSCSPEVAVRFQ